MLFSEFCNLIPDNICLEIIMPGMGAPISFSDLPEIDKNVVMTCKVTEVYPLSFEWLGIKVERLD